MAGRGLERSEIAKITPWPALQICRRNRCSKSELRFSRTIPQLQGTKLAGSEVQTQASKRSTLIVAIISGEVLETRFAMESMS
jgi:hypothetical protein